eukprot:INCI16396.12.p5 GENE.INCI16396.12~~INCI16396.12.p5  ORF type:complete len:100 (+),score=15.73 INCI16396.12:482-781(+)
MFKVMNSKKEWVGSPSSSLQLTFSSTANFHIINKQDLLNHDRFRSNPKFNNIIARGAYLQRCVRFRKLTIVSVQQTSPQGRRRELAVTAFHGEDTRAPE